MGRSGRDVACRHQVTSRRRMASARPVRFPARPQPVHAVADMARIFARVDLGQGSCRHGGHAARDVRHPGTLPSAGQITPRSAWPERAPSRRFRPAVATGGKAGRNRAGVRGPGHCAEAKIQQADPVGPGHHEQQVPANRPVNIVQSQCLRRAARWRSVRMLRRGIASLPGQSVPRRPQGDRSADMGRGAADGRKSALHHISYGWHDPNRA